MVGGPEVPGILDAVKRDESRRKGRFRGTQSMAESATFSKIFGRFLGFCNSTDQFE
jgi:hypothetical protein